MIFALTFLSLLEIAEYNNFSRLHFIKLTDDLVSNIQIRATICLLWIERICCLPTTSYHFLWYLLLLSLLLRLISFFTLDAASTLLYISCIAVHNVCALDLGIGSFGVFDWFEHHRLCVLQNLLTSCATNLFFITLELTHLWFLAFWFKERAVACAGVAWLLTALLVTQFSPLMWGPNIPCTVLLCLVLSFLSC